jgi:very-short-patch-repair endonuclease
MEIARVRTTDTLGRLGTAIVRYQPPSDSMPERRFKWLLFAALMRVGMFLEDDIEFIVYGEHQMATYRLDYAVACRERVVGFEVDGLAYHGDQKAFARDRKRDRDLALQGVETYRYTANEIAYQWPAIQEELESILQRLAEGIPA